MVLPAAADENSRSLGAGKMTFSVSDCFMLPRALFLAVAMTAIHDEDWQAVAREDWGGASEEDPVTSIKLVHDGEAPATRNCESVTDLPGGGLQSE